MTYKAKMRLGPVDFDWNPTQFTIPKKGKSYSVVETYTTVAFFSWGVTSIGQQISMEWEMMPEQQFDDLQQLLDNDINYLWTPVSGEAGSYDVEILDLQGKYMEKSIHDAPYRVDVKLVVMLKEEVS